MQYHEWAHTHAHLRSAIIGPLVTFILRNSTKCVEPWQQNIFCDYCPVDHPQWEVFTSVIGE